MIDEKLVYSLQVYLFITSQLTSFYTTGCSTGSEGGGISKLSSPKEAVFSFSR